MAQAINSTKPTAPISTIREDRTFRTSICLIGSAPKTPSSPSVSGNRSVYATLECSRAVCAWVSETPGANRPATVK